MSRLNGFLAGVRVIDLSRHLPGPLATLLLADMGAEVVKIEPPGGDPVRAMSPLDAGGRPIYFETLNAGKALRELDLSTAGGRAALFDLAADADVLVESFRPGTLERRGVSVAALRQANARLISCSLSGYGHDSPLRSAAGHDLNYVAGAGTLNGHGQPLDPPIADSSAALFAVAAIVGALFERARTGNGCEIEIALADAVMPLQALQLADLGLSGTVPRPGTGAINGGLACYSVYRTADGRDVALAALEPRFWQAFCEAAGHADWIDRRGDPMPQRELRADVARFFSTLTLEEVRRRFEGVDCCLSAVLDLAEAVASPHHRARRLVRQSPSGRWEALFPALVDGEPPVSRGTR